MSEKIGIVHCREIEVGDMVAFGRPESRKEPAVGRVTKVNRVTYRVELTRPWIQQTRTYYVGARFRVSHTMVWRHMAIEDEEDE